MILTGIVPQPVFSKLDGLRNGNLRVNIVSHDGSLSFEMMGTGNRSLKFERPPGKNFGRAGSRNVAAKIFVGSKEAVSAG